jgi:hypothetical protein
MSISTTRRLVASRGHSRSFLSRRATCACCSCTATNAEFLVMPRLALAVCPVDQLVHVRSWADRNTDSL